MDGATTTRGTRGKATTATRGGRTTRGGNANGAADNVRGRGGANAPTGGSRHGKGATLEDGARSSDEETTYEGANVARGAAQGRGGIAPRGQGVNMIVVRQDYDDEASGGNDDKRAARKKALREKERLRSLRRRRSQTDAQRSAERERSRRRRLAMTAEQRKAAAEAKTRRRQQLRQAKDAISAAQVLAMNLQGENA